MHRAKNFKARKYFHQKTTFLYFDCDLCEWGKTYEMWIIVIIICRKRERERDREKAMNSNFLDSNQGAFSRSEYIIEIHLCSLRKRKHFVVMLFFFGRLCKLVMQSKLCTWYINGWKSYAHVFSQLQQWDYRLLFCLFFCYQFFEFFLSFSTLKSYEKCFPFHFIQFSLLVN